MLKDTFFEKKRTIRLGDRLWTLDRPWIMGILNVTPDSFYPGSRVPDGENLTERAGRMLQAGADILDIGGYSSRPGAEHIAEEEEMERAVPAIRKVREAFPQAAISVDTFRASVAAEAMDAGADMVNDISAGELDPGMMELIAQRNVPYILMHMPGTPQDMQERTDHDDVSADLLRYLSGRLRLARAKGVDDPIIDPGFGFGKTIDQNYRLLRELGRFNELGVPMMVGLSRKSMIWKKLGTDPDRALNGTTVLHTMALQRGADILRVHDVREAVEVAEILKFERNAGCFD
jgi:dihydropteroate synthase